jgi:hypothetical protein
MRVFSWRTIGGVGRWLVVEGGDDDDIGGGEELDDGVGGTEPITMGIQTEGGRDEINDVDWAAAVFATSVDVEGVFAS